MKKIFLLTAAVAALVFTASCNKEEQVKMDKQQEISFSTVAMTKGYVTAAAFENTVVAQLHQDTPTTTKRVMWMSAYYTPSNGEPRNYFVDEPFAINANGETDGLWHHAPKLYWPIGDASRTLDFLAYSAETRLTGTKCVWDDANAASKLILNISEDQSQDDILYAGNAGNSTSTASVPMEFKHSQAWVEFDLKASEADLITINSIKLKNIYMKGELTVNGGATPSHSWNFASYRAGDQIVDDKVYESASSVYGHALGVESKYLDMLIPAQAQTSIVVNYVLAGQDMELEYTYDLGTMTWEAGKKYIYEITFNPQEITVTPTVTGFTAGVVGSDFPSSLN